MPAIKRSLIGILACAWLALATAAVAQTPVQSPFTRQGGTFALPVTAQAQTYAIEQPAGTMSYRGVNECAADLVVTSVTAPPPAVTEPVVVDGETVPNVRRVTSASGAVNRFTGTFFFARTARNFGSSPNPMAGSATRYVSVMALTAPPTWCAFRMLYGGGN